MKEVVPGLWLGSMADAETLDPLLSHSVSHVLSVAELTKDARATLLEWRALVAQRSFPQSPSVHAPGADSKKNGAVRSPVRREPPGSAAPGPEQGWPSEGPLLSNSRDAQGQATSVESGKGSCEEECFSQGQRRKAGNCQEPAGTRRGGRGREHGVAGPGWRIRPRVRIRCLPRPMGRSPRVAPLGGTHGTGGRIGPKEAAHTPAGAGEEQEGEVNSAGKGKASPGKAESRAVAGGIAAQSGRGGVLQWGQHLLVPLLDLEGENLLDRLPQCVQFLGEAGLGQGQRGPVGLVHCHAGVSRSVAVVVAYLMSSRKLNLCSALALLQRNAAEAWPNNGFLRQLKLWETMGCTVDPHNSAYKAFRLSLCSPSTRIFSAPPSSIALTQGQDGNREAALESNRAEHGPSVADVAADENSASAAAEHAQFRCRRCRAVLASSANVIPHQDEGATEHSPPQGPGDAEEQLRCSSVFVEPLRWMQHALGQAPGEENAPVMEGKLHCFRCKSRVGSFSWTGVRCKCGTWVTPAFQLHPTSIDM